LVSRSKILRSGYTTGACAAAAAKAAVLLLIRAEQQRSSAADQQFKMKELPAALLRYCATAPIEEVEIPFPDGSRVKFRIHRSSLITRHSSLVSRASVVKDAGDDPDVTNGAEIVAEARFLEQQSSSAAEQQYNKDKVLSTAALLHFCATALLIKGGKGVGVVTKPGLPIPAGEPAINPVPRRMITEAVMEAILEQQSNRATEQQLKDESTTALLRCCAAALEVTISVPEGEKLAKKTLNSRLGIIGGISILGTTGIVRPLSSEAWTASVTLSMNVAKAMGLDEIVLSAGRVSEDAHMRKYNLPVESYVMMGDYIEFSLLAAKKHEFKKIHLCAQWAKMLKIAMTTPQTHVRHGAIDMKKTVAFLDGLGVDIQKDIEFNTAREIFDYINSTLRNPQSAILKVCKAAKKYAEEIAGGIIPVITQLVSYQGEIILKSD
jgi:cobalt-precorrin-5B (C1)-methyltransferase